MKNYLDKSNSTDYSFESKFYLNTAVNRFEVEKFIYHNRLKIFNYFFQEGKLLFS